MHKLRMLIREAGLKLARTIGTRILDAETGRTLGKALIIPWRGKLHVIGLDMPVQPKFLPQQRLTYWKQELGFTMHPRPDFPRTKDRAGGDAGRPLDQ
jgi:hypothetical protein